MTNNNERRYNVSTSSSDDPPESKVTALVGMGFERKRSIEALRKHQNDPDKAAEDLLLNSSSSNSMAIVPVPNSNVIDLTAQDSDIQRAMQESMKDQNPLGGGDDLDINRAIEASLQASPQVVSPDPPNPYDRKRVGDTPVGLKNVGNTCYLNSLIQAYFHLLPFREAVLKVDSSASIVDEPKRASNTHDAALSTSNEKQSHSITSSEKCKQAIEILKQLQQIFYFLMHSSRKYIDPSSLLNALTSGGVGQFKTSGIQQDVSEFNDFFLERLEEALIACSDAKRSKMSSTEGQRDTERKSFLSELFSSCWTEEFVAQEADGSNSMATNTINFSELILEVGAQEQDIYTSLDAFTQLDIDEYSTASGHRTKATKFTWLKDPPPVLSFCLQRTRYDQETKSSSKTNAPLGFYKTLYLDRYLFQNKELALRLRDEIARHKQARAELEQQLHEFTNCLDKNLALDDAISAVLQHANKSNRLPEVISPLKEELEAVQRRMEELRSGIKLETHTMDTLFDKYKECPYKLHAVLVHDGAASYGHYWAYLLSKDGVWYKFNDTHVEVAEEETVMRDARGGYHNASAYRLIYIRNDTPGMNPVSKTTNLRLEKPLVDDEKAFRAECEQWDLDELKRKQDEEIRAVMATVMEHVLSHSGRVKNEIDTDYFVRYDSLEAFLYSIPSQSHASHPYLKVYLADQYVRSQLNEPHGLESQEERIVALASKIARELDVPSTQTVYDVLREVHSVLIPQRDMVTRIMDLFLAGMETENSYLRMKYLHVALDQVADLHNSIRSLVPIQQIEVGLFTAMQQRTREAKELCQQQDHDGALKVARSIFQRANILHSDDLDVLSGEWQDMMTWFPEPIHIETLIEHLQLPHGPRAPLGEGYVSKVVQEAQAQAQSQHRPPEAHSEFDMATDPPRPSQRYAVLCAKNRPLQIQAPTSPGPWNTTAATSSDSWRASGIA